MPKKKPMKGKPVVHEELDGLEIKINEFGQIISNYDVQQINKFLNREVDDKKLRDRGDVTEDGEYLNTHKEKKYWKGEWSGKEGETEETGKDLEAEDDAEDKLDLETDLEEPLNEED